MKLVMNMVKWQQIGKKLSYSLVQEQIDPLAELDTEI